MLTQLLCCMLQADNNADDDWLDYNNELRIGILEAYSGILNGLSAGGFNRLEQVRHHDSHFQ